MNETKRKVPKLRFPGFTEDWEQRKLGEITDVRDGTHASPKFYNDGFPLVTSKNLKNGRINFSGCSLISKDDYEEINKRSKVELGDILFGMIGTIGNPVIVDSTGFAIKNVALIKLSQSINNKFIYHLLTSNVFVSYIARTNVGGTQKFIALNQIRDFDFLAPNIEEQEYIVNILDAISNLITLHQRKLENLKLKKKALLQKLFPKNGEQFPELRFPGFTDAWEQCKLIDYLKVSCDKNKDNKFGKADVLSVSGEYGIVNQIEFQGRSFAGVSVANYGVVEIGDVVYTKSPLKANPYGIIKTNKLTPGIVSTLYAVYKPLENIDSDFVQVYFEHDGRMNNYMKPLVNKGAKNDMKVTDENALKGDVIFPAKEEQEHIVKCFSTLDNLITLHQRKLEHLQLQKKALLQQMFV